MFNLQNEEKNGVAQLRVEEHREGDKIEEKQRKIEKKRIKNSKKEKEFEKRDKSTVKKITEKNHKKKNYENCINPRKKSQIHRKKRKKCTRRAKKLSAKQM